MKTLEEILLEQINNIITMLERLAARPKSQKQKEKLYKELQSIENKLDKLI